MGTNSQHATFAPPAGLTCVTFAARVERVDCSSRPAIRSEEMPYVRFTMGDVPLVPWHVDWMADKGVARVRDRPPTDGTFTFANTHLAGGIRIGRNRYVTTRLSQAMQLARSLGRAWGARWCLAGDINTRRRTSWAFRALQARARIVHDTGIGAQASMRSCSAASTSDRVRFSVPRGS